MRSIGLFVLLFLVFSMQSSFAEQSIKTRYPKVHQTQGCSGLKSFEWLRCQGKEIGKKVKIQAAKVNQSFKRFVYKKKRDVSFLLTRTPLRKLQEITLPHFTTNNSPVIRGNIKIVKHGNGAHPIVELYVDEIYDTDGSVVEVEWNFEDGTVVKLEEGEFDSQARIFHVFRNSDHYDAILRIKDDLGALNIKTVYVETPENSEPSGSFTAEYDISDPYTVNFDFHPIDSDDFSFTYMNEACLDSDQTQSFSCTYPSFGTYPFYGRIIDSKNTAIEFSTELEIDGTTIKSRPIPMLRADTYFGEAPLTVNFDGTHSFDLNGSVVSYEWDFGDEFSPENYSKKSKDKHTFHKSGTYEVKLYVQDNEGNISESTRMIFVAPTEPSVSSIVAIQDGANKVRFDVSNSSIKSPSDSDMFFWDFGDGNLARGRIQEHTYATSGQYDIKLKIVDILGETHNLTKTLTIGSGDDSPIARIEASDLRPWIHDLVEYSGLSSADPQLSDPLEFHWTFDDGEVFVGDYIERSAPLKGIRNVELRVTNSRGLSDIARIQYNVFEQFSEIHAHINITPKVGIAPLTVSFDSLGTTSHHPIEKHLWTGDGIFLDQASGKIEFTEPGEYQFKYFAKDISGNEGLTEGRVIVHAPSSLPASNEPPIPHLNVEAIIDAPGVYYFNCSDSSDPDDEVVACEWRINGIHVSDAFEFPRWLLEKIPYHIELTVIDSWGARTSAYETIDLSGNSEIALDFNFFPFSPLVSQNVNFEAAFSHLPGRSITSYYWDFGDTNTAEGAVVNHTYALAGNYTVTLVMTDDQSNLHTITKEIQVQAVGSFQIELLAQDSDLTGGVKENSTFRSFGAPQTIKLSVLAKTNSISSIKEASWDFGDGNTAFGTVVEHTFHKPGSYTVEVTAIDSTNNTQTKELTVEIGTHSNCYDKNSKNICLNDIDAISGFIANSDSEKWILGHDLGSLNYSSLIETYPSSWAKLIQLDGTEKSYDISGAIDISGNRLEIDKNRLPELNNLNAPYRLEVLAKSQTQGPLIGTWPYFYVGASNLNLTVDADDMKIILINPSAQLRKYFSLGSSREITISDLVPGKYAVIAFFEEKSFAQVIDVPAGDNSLHLQPSEEFIGNNKTNRKKIIASDLFSFHQKFSKSSSWSHSLCGENSPFMKSPFQDKGATFIDFSSTEPAKSSSFKSIPNRLGSSMRLSCSVVSPGIFYGQNKWKYKDGPKRCFGDVKPHFYWNEYLKTLGVEDSPIVIKYDIKDDSSGRSETNHFVTSASDIMKRSGVELNDLTSRIGLPANDNEVTGQKIDYDIHIPADMQRPQIKFELISDHNSNPSSLYLVDCHVPDLGASPRLISIEAASMSDDIHSAEFNGRLSLSSRYGHFPIQYDGRSSSPESAKAEIAKAKYKVSIKKSYRPEIVWQGVRLEFSYAGIKIEELFPFVGTPMNNAKGDIYTNEILIDTSILENIFHWVRGENIVNIKFTPVGKITNDYDFSGESKSLNFHALFDAQTVNAQIPQICGSGFFSSSLSTFARDEYLSLLLDSSISGAEIRCGDMSTPFGGPFNVSSVWNYKGQRNGLEGLVRTFNDSPADQDDYDDNNAEERMLDVEAYLSFAEDIHDISLIVNEQIGGVDTAKKEVFDYCKPISGDPISPCKTSTTFTNISEDMIHTLCLKETRASFTPPGCPTVDIIKLIRFARWAEYNHEVIFKRMNKVDSVFNMATGFYFPVLGMSTNWQEKAVAFAQWPDGRSILKPATTEDYFMEEKLESCLASDKCSDVSKFFSGSENEIEMMSISTGWK